MQSGLIPTNLIHLLYILPPIILWWGSRRWARDQHITIWHNSALAVSFWEEILFRGIIFGAVLTITGHQILAVTVSSLLFGLFHLRNRWWASWRQLIYTCLYTGLVVGPILAVVRLWSGDIYLGILLHYLNNFVSMRTAKTVPTDDFLMSCRSRQNWFERLFSGYWLRAR